jgi:hypothetical protein
VVSLAATAYLPLVLLVAPSHLAQREGVSGGDVPPLYRGLDLDPTTIAAPDPVWSALLAGAYVLMPFSLVVPFAAVVRRFRAATGDDRVRMRWLLWAAIVDLLVMGTVSLLPPEWTSAGLLIAVGLTGFAITAGIMRPYLLDIDRLLGGTLLYAALVGRRPGRRGQVALARRCRGPVESTPPSSPSLVLAVMARYGTGCIADTTDGAGRRRPVRPVPV